MFLTRKLAESVNYIVFSVLIYNGEEKPRKKPHPVILTRTGIEPGPAA